MKALVTGSSGFVGTYLKEELQSNGYETAGMDIKGSEIKGDLSDVKGVMELLKEVSPDVIFHLAGQASVGESWKDFKKTIDINVGCTLNLLDAARYACGDAKILLVGSSDQYGRVAMEDCPIKESHELHPASPYAVSKMAQEQLALLYQKAYGLDILLTRSFNHTGPGQRTGFAVPDFASQIVRIERGEKPVIYVGNLSAKRDICDVRDVVRAYRLLAQKGRAGEVYNVGSGQAYSLEDILASLISLSGLEIRVEKDAEKCRPVDLPVIQSDIGKLKSETGFVLKYSILDTLKDTLDYWRSK